MREKELSLSELNQLNLILESLMKEIDLLKKQRDALKERNKEDEAKLKESLEKQLENANQELNKYLMYNYFYRELYYQL